MINLGYIEEINKQVSVIESYIQQFYAIRLMDVKKSIVFNKKRHLYGESHNSERQLDLIHNIINNSLVLLDIMNCYKNSDYVPHTSYMKKKDNLVFIKKQDVYISSCGFLNGIDNNHITYNEQNPLIKYPIKKLGEFVKQLQGNYTPKFIRMSTDKPEINRDVLNELQNLLKSIYTYKGLLIIEEKYTSELYKEVFESNIQNDQIRDVIYFSFKILEELYKETNINFVPHNNYMRVPDDVLLYYDIISLSSIYSSIFKFINQNEIKITNEKSQFYINEMMKIYEQIQELPFIKDFKRVKNK